MRKRIYWGAIVIVFGTLLLTYAFYHNRDIPIHLILHSPVVTEGGGDTDTTTAAEVQSNEGQSVLDHKTINLAEQEESPILSVNIEMVYVHESPDNSWTGSWKNGCEEAAIAMVEYYYKNVKHVPTPTVMAFMQTLFDAQQEKYREDANSDAARNIYLIEQYAHFDANILENPSLEDIKSEINLGRPVIALHRGFDLQNTNIPFLATGSSYHATVVTGYDDAREQFIVHDTGDAKDGIRHRYAYDLFMNSLHDYDYTEQLANGPPRVIFTSPQHAPTDL